MCLHIYLPAAYHELILATYQIFILLLLDTVKISNIGPRDEVKPRGLIKEIPQPSSEIIPEPSMAEHNQEGLINMAR